MSEKGKINLSVIPFLLKKRVVIEVLIGAMFKNKKSLLAK
jgi:hypothetical protein